MPTCSHSCAPQETSVAHGQDGCRRHSKTGTGGESSRDAKCFSQSQGSVVHCNIWRSSSKFTGTSAPRVLGAKTRNFRVNFERRSSHLETQIRGRCLKRLWSCSCHCSTVTRFLRFLKGYGSRGAEGTKCDHRLRKLSLKGGRND